MVGTGRKEEKAFTVFGWSKERSDVNLPSETRELDSTGYMAGIHINKGLVHRICECCLTHDSAHW